jgi:hypothetical protein
MSSDNRNTNAFITDSEFAEMSQNIKDVEALHADWDALLAEQEEQSSPQTTMEENQQSTPLQQLQEQSPPAQDKATVVTTIQPAAPNATVVSALKSASSSAVVVSPAKPTAQEGEVQTTSTPAPGATDKNQPSKSTKSADKGKAVDKSPSNQSKGKKGSKGASSSATALKPRDKVRHKGSGILPYLLPDSLQHFLLTRSFTAEASTRSARNSLRHASKSYSFREDKLCKKLSTGDIRLIPKSEDLPQIFTQCHGQGHPGQRATYNRVRRTYWWPGMKTTCYQYVKSCEQCQKQHDVSQRTDRSLQTVSVQGLLPFQKVAIDLAGPLPKTISGNKHIVVMVCYLTKWIEAVAVPDNTAFTVAQTFFREVVCRHGCPLELSMDNGSHFQGEFLIQLQAWGMERVRIAPYNPQANGLVERCIQTLKGSLSRTALQRTDTWDEQLPWTLLAYRNVQQKSTGYTPYSLVYGREMMLPEQIQLYANRFQMSEEESLQHLTGQLTVVAKQMEHSILHAQGNVELSQQKQRLDFETRKKSQEARVKQVRELPLNSLVLAKRPGSSVTSLQPSWIGPFVLQGFTTDQKKTATLLDTSTNKVIYRAVAQVKPYHEPDPLFASTSQISMIPKDPQPGEMQRT